MQCEELSKEDVVLGKIFRAAREHLIGGGRACVLDGTDTMDTQEDCEHAVGKKLLVWLATQGDEEKCALDRVPHCAYLYRNLKTPLHPAFSALDASRPWMTWWITHSLDLMGVLEDFPADLKSSIVSFLKQCEHPAGGYGGGPSQFAHLAPTFAAISTLCSLGTSEALESINRETLKQFLLKCKNEDGSFSVHTDGECDVRGAYCAMAVASMCDLVTPELCKNTANWVASCQNYEGGIAAEPGDEAHGGYALCGLGAMVIMGEESQLDINALLRWACMRQMEFAGGFQGRTNKLVDGCYSYWVGGLFPILDAILRKTDSELHSSHYLYNQQELQRYLLCCCQWPKGGLVDKPPKRPDFYHTCYTLSGLSLSQDSHHGTIHNISTMDSLLRKTDPVLNICVDKLEFTRQFWANLDPVSTQKNEAGI